MLDKILDFENNKHLSACGLPPQMDVFELHRSTDIKHPPKQTPIRILVSVWWLSTIVIVNIYLGILFGQLVVPHRPKSIETLEELVSQNATNWCVTRGSAIFDLFWRSDSQSIYGRLARGMRNVSSADEGVQRVVDSGWAFIREKSILTFKVSGACSSGEMRACCSFGAHCTKLPPS